MSRPSTLKPAEPLWREVVGARLRRLRHRRGETLTAVAVRAGVSPQYLSEVERGLKEPSSEMLAAISGALETRLVDLTLAVTRTLASRSSMAAQPSPAAPSTPVTGRASGSVLALAA